MFCKHCGMESTTPNVCSWCRHPLTAATGDGSKSAAPPVQKRSAAPPPIVRRPTPAAPPPVQVQPEPERVTYQEPEPEYVAPVVAEAQPEIVEEAPAPAPPPPVRRAPEPIRRVAPAPQRVAAWEEPAEPDPDVIAPWQTAAPEPAPAPAPSPEPPAQSAGAGAAGARPIIGVRGRPMRPGAPAPGTTPPAPIQRGPAPAMPVARPSAPVPPVPRPVVPPAQTQPVAPAPIAQQPPVVPPAQPAARPAPITRSGPARIEQTPVAPAAATPQPEEDLPPLATQFQTPGVGRTPVPPVQRTAPVVPVTPAAAPEPLPGVAPYQPTQSIQARGARPQPPPRPQTVQQPTEQVIPGAAPQQPVTGIHPAYPQTQPPHPVARPIQPVARPVPQAQQYHDTHGEHEEPQGLAAGVAAVHRPSIPSVADLHIQAAMSATSGLVQSKYYSGQVVDSISGMQYDAATGTVTSAPPLPGSTGPPIIFHWDEPTEDIGPLLLKFLASFTGILLIAGLVAGFLPDAWVAPLSIATFLGGMLLPVFHLIPWQDEDSDDAAWLLILLLVFGPAVGLVIYGVICAVRQEANISVLALLGVALGTRIIMELCAQHGFTMVMLSPPWTAPPAGPNGEPPSSLVAQMFTSWTSLFAMVGWYVGNVFHKADE